MDIPSFWVLVFAIFCEDEIAVEITNLVLNTNELITESRSVIKEVQDNPKKYIKAYFAAKREDSKKK